MDIPEEFAAFVLVSTDDPVIAAATADLLGEEAVGHVPRVALPPVWVEKAQDRPPAFAAWAVTHCDDPATLERIARSTTSHEVATKLAQLGPSKVAVSFLQRLALDGDSRPLAERLALSNSPLHTKKARLAFMEACLKDPSSINPSSYTDLTRALTDSFPHPEYLSDLILACARSGAPLALSLVSEALDYLSGKHDRSIPWQELTATIDDILTALAPANATLQATRLLTEILHPDTIYLIPLDMLKSILKHLDPDTIFAALLPEDPEDYEASSSFTRESLDYILDTKEWHRLLLGQPLPEDLFIKALSTPLDLPIALDLFLFAPISTTCITAFASFIEELTPAQRELAKTFLEGLDLPDTAFRRATYPDQVLIDAVYSLTYGTDLVHALSGDFTCADHLAVPSIETIPRLAQRLTEEDLPDLSIADRAMENFTSLDYALAIIDAVPGEIYQFIQNMPDFSGPSTPIDRYIYKRLADASRGKDPSFALQCLAENQLLSLDELCSTMASLASAPY